MRIRTFLCDIALSGDGVCTNIYLISNVHRFIDRRIWDGFEEGTCSIDCGGRNEFGI